MAKTIVRADDGREWHEVVRDAEGKITGVLLPSPPDLSETVLALAHNTGFNAGAQAGATAAARAYAQAGAEAGFRQGYEQGLEAGFRVGAEYHRRWPNGDGPVVPIDLRIHPADGEQAA